MASTPVRLEFDLMHRQQLIVGSRPGWAGDDRQARVTMGDMSGFMVVDRMVDGDSGHLETFDQ
jgi:hypothetical protein